MPSEKPEPVAQPPPAGESWESPSAAAPLAKPGKAAYRRNLPHLQAEGKTIFLTFCTANHVVLPESVRTQVLHHCLHDHGSKIHVHGAVVMPDHVHMVFTPLWDAQGYPYTLAEITNGIKGASAHSVNRLLERKGSVWQDESFDRVLRSDEAVRAKVEYICANPVRKGLCRNADEYPWLWREWIEGVAQPPPAGESWESPTVG